MQSGVRDDGSSSPPQSGKSTYRASISGGTVGGFWARGIVRPLRGEHRRNPGQNLRAFDVSEPASTGDQSSKLPVVP